MIKSKLWFLANVLFVLLFVGGMQGCVTAPPPNEEYTLAKVAIEAARAVQAVKYSAGYWHKAEEFYRQATILYAEREYIAAKELFIKARISAERAENTARLMRHKNGDIL